MENASKALLIAGAVLLSIMILTVGIILYNNFSDTANRYSDNLSATELNKFNAEFEVFRGRTDVTAQEIVSLINMVDEYRKKTPKDVTVLVDGIVIEKNNAMDFLKNNLKSTYNCKNDSIIYNSENQVVQITFNWYIEDIRDETTVTQEELFELIGQCFAARERHFSIDLNIDGEIVEYHYYADTDSWKYKINRQGNWIDATNLNIVDICKEKLQGRDCNLRKFIFEGKWAADDSRPGTWIEIEI